MDPNRKAAEARTDFTVGYVIAFRPSQMVGSPQKRGGGGGGEGGGPY